MKHAKTNEPNTSQKEAIYATDGPVLIIAGPGSGKTFTLVERIIYLITEKKVPLGAILVVTFSNKAARELVTRISNRIVELGLNVNVNDMYLGTFHSVCLRILEDYREFTRLHRNYALWDQFDQQYALFQNLNLFADIEHAERIINPTGNPIGRWPRSENLMIALNKAIEEDLPLETLEDATHEEVRVLGALLRKYNEFLKEQNALDFASIQADALSLLRGHPDILKKLQEKFTYLMVDEYQDTNTIQEQLLILLMGDRKNLCVVGDDDQGLYRFRGATIRNILEFPSLFEQNKCRQIRLTVNYRSHPGIISFYNNWMGSKNWQHGGTTFRYSKTIEFNPNVQFPDLPSVIKVGAQGADAWHEEVEAFIKALLKTKKVYDLNQIAFLFNSVQNERVQALSDYLETHEIPVYAPRSNRFFEREEVRLVLGAFLFLFPRFVDIRQTGRTNPLSVWTYYDNQCFAAFTTELRNPENRAIKNWAARRAKEHTPLIKNTDYSFAGLFYQLLQFPLFSRYLSEEALNGIDRGRAARNLAMISSLLTKFDYLYNINILTSVFLERNLLNLFNNFLRFLFEGGIGEFEDEEVFAPSGCISFLTIHQAKGLEFPITVVGSLHTVPKKQGSPLFDLLKNNYCKKTPFEPADEEKNYDFWRLYYTAFSRAKNLLVLTAAERQGRGRCPSKHFQELWNSVSSWRNPSVSLAGLDYHDIRSIDLKHEYSFTSHITLFENCPQQYHFYRDLAFSPVRQGARIFGSLVHETIEDIHKTVLRGEEHTLSIEKVRDWFNANYANLIKREHQYLAPLQKEIALGHVERYFANERRNWCKLKEAEVEISLVKEEYILSGTIDLIRADDGTTVELIDFKAEKKPDMERDKKKLDQYRRQLEVYAHIVEEKTGQSVSKMHLYYTGETNSSPYVSFSKSRNAIDKTVADFDTVVSRIEAKDFSMGERPLKNCEDCDMKHFCDAR